MRYVLAIGGLLVGAVAMFAIWMLLPRNDSAPPQALGSIAATAAETAPVPGEITADTEDGSLRVCNQTRNTVSIALGYKAKSGWQSEGWWVAPPGECTTVYNGQLDARYYYIYAADDVSGGSWDGKNFMCTRDESFTIFGVEDCLARGYERTGFFEVDTQNRSNWMLQLTDTEVLGAEPVGDNEEDSPLEGELDGEPAGGDPADPEAEGADAQ